MRFAKWVFLLAGLYGVAVLVPMYFTEVRYGRDHPPPVARPEFYYGFAGVALAFQAVFLLIAADPVRYRPVMLPAVLEKASFVAAVAVLYPAGRAPAVMAAAAALDGMWGVLFVIAYLRTPRGERAGP